ncbi:hypothetical protein [Actinocatenispora rupis]|uniref:Uncharacterized protein n=1 Tax=Actinocatenispora rupis TaxID=519421 RepID=A0A8J3NDT2_9ACTN|nr:hypothetical protein [Actinocatenispora rupis]GID13282.1 hypothetical protein Aru02nite_41710 [Actinocatenispora rupis]
MTDDRTAGPASRDGDGSGPTGPARANPGLAANLTLRKAAPDQDDDAPVPGRDSETLRDGTAVRPGTDRDGGVSTPDTDRDGSVAEPTRADSTAQPATAQPATGKTDAGKVDSGKGGGGADPEGRWSRFAPVEPKQPGRGRRVGAALARFAGHEWTVVSVAGLLLAVVLTWPTMLHPASTVPQDIYDPLLQTWQVAWDGHALLTNPLHLWDSNTFYPEHDTLAYSDSLLGYAPLGMIGSGPVAALVRYNVLYVLVHALAFVGTYALCRQVGARRAAAAMAAAAFAYAPWRLAHGGHLNILSTGGIALALAMLARGHGVTLRRDAPPQRRIRWGWALGGWLVAAWQVTLGFGLGLPFAYVLGLVVVVGCVIWLVRRIRRRAGAFHVSLLVGNLVGLVVFGLTCLYMGLPYLRAVNAHPYARRGAAELAWFSPPWQGYFIAPEQSSLWGDAHAKAREALPFQPEMTLLVGMVLLAFALLGVVLSTWSVRTRVLLVAGVAVSVVLGMGTRFPGGGRYTYLLLHDHLPAWDAIRTPGRLVVWTTLLLALLAAGAVSALGDRAGEVALSRGRNPRRLGPALRVLVAVPLLLVLVEGWNRTPHPVVPPEPHELRGVAGPVLILPTDQLTDERYMYWSTDGFPTMVNGGSGFQPARQDQIRKVATAFPDQSSVAYLRDLGVRTVVVFRDGLPGTPYQDAISRPVAGLGVSVRDTGAAVVFTLH